MTLHSKTMTKEQFDDLVKTICAEFDDETESLIRLWVDIVEDTSNDFPSVELYKQDRADAMKECK